MPLDQNHYVALANGKFDNSELDHRKNLEKIFTTLKNAENSTKPLVLHFHGGLVNEKSGKTIAENLTPVYQSAGAYPLFFVWESGLIESVSRNLPEHFNKKLSEISKDDVYDKLFKLLKKFAVSKLKTIDTPGLRGPDDKIKMVENILVEKEIDNYNEQQLDSVAPAELEIKKTELTQLEELIEADLKTTIESLGKSINNADMSAITRGEVNETTNILISKNVLELIKVKSSAVNENTRGIFAIKEIIKYFAKIIVNVFNRYRNETHHGLRLTISEEILRSLYIDHIGTYVWSDMKKDTMDAFEGNAATYGGTALIEHMKADPEITKRRIVLVGHSTGAVYICNLLNKCKHYNLHPDVKFDIVFLAPACTHKLMAETIRDHSTRIKNIRSFGMQDELEMKDGIVPVVYPASLLYFVSALLEGTEEENIDTPILGMQRYLAAKSPYTENTDIRDVETYMGKHMYWSVTSTADGMRSNCISHGAFDDELSDTIASVKYIIEKGY